MVRLRAPAAMTRQPTCRTISSGEPLACSITHLAVSDPSRVPPTSLVELSEVSCGKVRWPAAVLRGVSGRARAWLSGARTAVASSRAGSGSTRLACQCSSAARASGESYSESASFLSWVTLAEEGQARRRVSNWPALGGDLVRTCGWEAPPPFPPPRHKSDLQGWGAAHLHLSLASCPNGLPSSRAVSSARAASILAIAAWASGMNAASLTGADAGPTWWGRLARRSGCAAS